MQHSHLFKIALPDVSEKDESVVFHEERYIRMFLRERGLVLRHLEPGTYLRVSGQEWFIDITWEGRSYLKWSARSTVSGFLFVGGNQTIELLHGRGADEEYRRIMGIITSDVSEDQIANYSELEAGVLSGLENIGYSRSSPPCELHVIESTKNVFGFGVYPIGGPLREPLVSFIIKATSEESPDSLIELINEALSEGDMSHYSIRNKEPFMRKLTTWMSRNIPVLEDMYQEPEGWEVTLSVDLKKYEIHWEAKQYLLEFHQTGLLYDDKKVLLDGNIGDAIQDVREIVEGDLVPELGHISNLDKVLTVQVPEVIRELRQDEQ